jgi:hypothetical protein
VKTSDTRLSDQRDPKTGSSNYVQNTTSQQASTNFNISGNGTAGGTLSGNSVNAATQYNLGGQKVLSLSSDNGLSLGSSGNVGIGITSNSKLAVAGTVESTNGGFKFPDGTVQATAAAKAYITLGLQDLEVDHSGSFTNISTLNLPPGVYLLTATVQFQNKANDLFADNTRQVRCYFNDEFLGSSVLERQAIRWISSPPQCIPCSLSLRVAPCRLKAEMFSMIAARSSPRRAGSPRSEWQITR